MRRASGHGSFPNSWIRSSHPVLWYSLDVNATNRFFLKPRFHVADGFFTLHDVHTRWMRILQTNIRYGFWHSDNTFWYSRRVKESPFKTVNGFWYAMRHECRTLASRYYARHLFQPRNQKRKTVACNRCGIWLRKGFGPIPIQRLSSLGFLVSALCSTKVCSWHLLDTPRDKRFKSFQWWMLSRQSFAKSPPWIPSISVDVHVTRASAPLDKMLVHGSFIFDVQGGGGCGGAVHCLPRLIFETIGGWAIKGCPRSMDFWHLWTKEKRSQQSTNVHPSASASVIDTILW